LRHGADHFAPENRRVEHVRLVDRAEPLFALARYLEAEASNAAYLGLAVEHGVEAFGITVGVDTAAARRTEIDVAGELAHNHQVQSGNYLRLERGRCGKFGIEERGTQIGEQAQRLADGKQSLLGANGSRQGIVLRSTDGAEQDSIGA